MLNRIIEKIVSFWTDKDIIKKEDEDIYIYGLTLIFSTMINIAMVMVSAVIMGRVLESIALLAMIIPLQSCGGGYHAKTHLKCFLIMFLGWWAVTPMIPYITLPIGTAIACTSLAIVFTLAPVRHVNVPMSKERFAKMKIIVRRIAILGAVSGVWLLWFGGRAGLIGGSLIMGMAVVAFSIAIARLFYWRDGKTAAERQGAV